MRGWATAAGTYKYAQSLIAGGKTHPTHFREVNNLWLGSMGMGTYLGDLRAETDARVISAIRASIACGVNVIDTSINYRHQLAERAVGAALQGVPREQVFLSTKHGYIPGDAASGITPNEYLSLVVEWQHLAAPEEVINHNCTSIKYLQHQLQQSLANLGVETIDLVYLHNTAESQKVDLGGEAYYEMLGRCFSFYEAQIKARKVRTYGLATWDCFRVHSGDPGHVDLRRCLTLAKAAQRAEDNEACGFKYVQLPYNVAMPEANTLPYEGKRSFFEVAQELGVGVFTSVPLLQGRALRHPQIKELKAKYKTRTAAQAAIQFARSRGGPLVAPLVGQKDPAHVEENLEIVKVPTT